MKFCGSMLSYNQNDGIEIREAQPCSYCQFVMGRSTRRIAGLGARGLPAAAAGTTQP
jgi:hypothetical protein